MNFKFRITVIILSTLIFSVIATACGRISEDGSSADSATEYFIKTTTSTPKPIVTETTEISTSYITNSKSREFTEKQIVKEVSAEVYTTNELCYEDDNIDMIMDNPKTLNQQVLGNILDEDDAKEKGRTVFIELWGHEYIDEFESDFIIINGKQVKYERDNPPYRVNYYEKYDAWIITAVKRSGKTEDGKGINSTGLSSFVIIRGNDGKVLAVD